jgi:two-component system chemotaxis sensor kinase CheA
MAKKNQKIIKTLQKIAEEIDNTSLNDPDAWHKISNELGAALKSVPKKKPATLELLKLVGQGFDAMGAQSVKEPLSLADAIWQGLNAAGISLADDAVDEEALNDFRQKLEEILGPAAKADGNMSSQQPDDNGHPTLDCLDDAAAFLVQLDADNLEELQSLRESLQNFAGGDELSEFACSHLEQAIQKIDQLVQGDTADADQTLAEAGMLLEEAMSPVETLTEPVDHTDISQTAAESPSGSDNGAMDHMPQDVDEELLSEFIAEGSDLNEKAEEALLSLETNPEDMESIGTVFRAFHTVKGTSAFLELTLIAELGHHAESLLSRVRDGEIRYSGGYADLSLRALDMIKELMGGVQAALSGAPLLKPAGYDELVKVLADPEGAGISDETGDMTAPRVGDLLVAQGKIDREALEEAADAHPDEKLGVAVVKSQAASVKDVGQALRAQKRIKAGQKVVDSSVRVSTRRLDRLIDMVGELVIAHSMVAQDDLIIGSDNHDLAKKVAHSSKIVRELQDISMSMRMVPLKATFNKMARLVRDVARKVGKNVNFVTEGEDTEIDRNLVNIINDPLVHMVRNAVDHGIELPEQRIQNGKSESGEVQLLAYHSAGSVVVEIRDDGQGLEREMIIKTAREKGLIAESGDSNERTLSDRDVFNMIFEPGFSTAQVVTDVSGRGVGMDVVKKNIESLRGQVEIKSEYGKGSVFKMSLPLTLAIIDGMVVRVGSETYVIPTVSIIRSIKPRTGDLSTVLNRGEMLSLPSGLVPLYRMDRMYHLEDATDDPAEAIIVIVEDEERQAGLVVDELIGRQQVVIKSLGESMKNIPGISGGAIMPDGRVGLIIDVGGLVKFASNGDDGDYREDAEPIFDQTMAA